MAKLNFDDGAVWDNTLSGAARYSTKVPGHGNKSNRPIWGVAGDLRGLQESKLPLLMATGTFDFDSSYPTGGENIEELWAIFPRGLTGCIFAQPNASGVKTVEVDTGNKKLKGYTGAFATEVGAGTNLSTVTGLRFFAWGY